MTCSFCDVDTPLFGNALAYVKYDMYPVSPGHVLIIPRRHVSSWFDLTPEEHAAVSELIERAKEYLDPIYSPAGYNIGVNCGRLPVRRSCMPIFISYRGMRAMHPIPAAESGP